MRKIIIICVFLCFSLYFFQSIYFFKKIELINYELSELKKNNKRHSSLIIEMHGLILKLESEINAKEIFYKYEDSAFGEVISKSTNLKYENTENDKVNEAINTKKEIEKQVIVNEDFKFESLDELKNIILNSGNLDVERMAAMNQLLNKLRALRIPFSDSDSSLFIAMFDIYESSDDYKIKARALEISSNTNLINSKIFDGFKRIALSSNNDYVKSISIRGILNQFYRSMSEDEIYNRRLAAYLLEVTESPHDDRMQKVVENVLGTDRIMKKIKDRAN